MIEIIDTTSVELVSVTASDLAVARSAWVSQVGADAREKNSEHVEGLIKYLYTHAHFSPFEHGQFTFLVDVPIFVAREWQRHRTWSYNEKSARYSKMQPRFYIPPVSRPLVQTGKVGHYIFESGTDAQHTQVQDVLKQSYQEAWDAYERLLAAGIAKEVARNVLPTALMTQFYATVNPRNLMAFLDLRTAPDAQYEIREAAGMLKTHLKTHMPLTYKAYNQ